MTTQQQTQPKEFNKFQELVWPIHNYELKNFANELFDVLYTVCVHFGS